MIAHSLITLKNTRLFGLVFFLLVANIYYVNAQSNLFLNTPGYKHAAIPMGVQEYKSSLYFMNKYMKEVHKYSSTPWSSRNYSVLHTVSKKGIADNSLKSAYAIGDTLQPDSVLGYEVLMSIGNNSVNLFYTKDILVDTALSIAQGRFAIGLYMTQMDTNLNIVFRDKLLKMTPLPQRIWALPCPGWQPGRTG